jgi:hypothetical protein
MSEEGAAVRRVDDTAKSEGDIEMGKVMTGGTMSLDGYIAGPEESGFDLLFQWYGNGDVEIPSASPDVPPPRISAASAELIKSEWEETGALTLCRHRAGPRPRNLPGAVVGSGGNLGGGTDDPETKSVSINRPSMPTRRRCAMAGPRTQRTPVTRPSSGTARPPTPDVVMDDGVSLA